jgi:two-component system, NarL family, response regulator LiaR
MNQIIRVLVVDDHTVIRQGLRALLDTIEDIEVIAEANDGAEAVRKAKIFTPDVILLDLMMPRQSGMEAIPEIRREAPRSRILVLSSHSEDDDILAAIKAGAHGYLLKGTSAPELFQAIRSLHHGQPLLHSVIARKLIREVNLPTILPPFDEPLTEREVEILILIARGFAVPDIAGKLLVSEQIVYDHVNNILDKLHRGHGQDSHGQ